jgi:structural maintenance of chromosome 1
MPPRAIARIASAGGSKSGAVLRLLEGGRHDDDRCNRLTLHFLTVISIWRPNWIHSSPSLHTVEPIFTVVMPVTYLELENFKSYGGLQRIGPFQSFSCIIGPNGSGKSNCMDALSFVLGVQSRELRSTQMKDLIFRPPNRTNVKLTAKAALYYRDETTNQTTKFQRIITPRGQGEYRVNDKAVSYAEYEEHLGEIGVLVKARNFLVFQGDVESLARKSPSEFVELLEQISLSAELKQDYENALKAKEEAEADAMFCYNKQKGMKGERRALKEQKEEAERFEDLLQQKLKLQTDFYLWQLYHMEVDRQERESHLVELRAALSGLLEQEQDHMKILKEAKRKAAASRKDTQAAENERVEIAGDVAKLEPSMIQVQEEVKTFQLKLEQTLKALKIQKEQAEKHDSKLEELKAELKISKKDLRELERNYEEAKRDALPDKVTLTPQQEEEYERVKEAAATASVEPRRHLATLQKKLETARAKAAECSSQLEEAKKRKAEVNREVADYTERSEKISQVRGSLISTT